MTSVTAVDLHVSRVRVLQDLATKPHFGYALVHLDQLKGCLTLQTGMRLLSWGEKLTVTIQERGAGCRVVIEGKRLHALNFTSRPQDAVAELASKIRQHYGPPSLSPGPQ